MKNIHVIPTSSPSKIFYIAENFHLEKGQLIEPKSYYNVYITADEEIKEGDWHLNIVTNKISKYNIGLLNPNRSNYKKIILTTDQDLIADGVQAIADTFLEWFVKNPSCEFVEINKEYLSNTGEWKEVLLPSEWEVDTKFRYKIIIPQEEPKQELLPEFTISKDIFDKISDLPKQETLEEAAYRLSAEKFEPKHIGFMLGVIEGAKWQAERTYSEEEAIQLLIKFNQEIQEVEDVRGWFEQFKKK